MEPVANEGGKNRSSTPAQEMFAKKKPKTYAAVHEGSSATPRLVIDLTSSKGKKDEATRSVLVMSAIPKVASSIAYRIHQRRSSVVPSVPKFMPKCLSGVKSGPLLERLATMKSNKVDSAAKMVPKPTHLATETNSPTEKNETTHLGSCEKSTKPVSGEAAEICAVLKPDILEDMDVYAKFVDSIKGVVYLSSFVKHMTEYRMTALLAMMQKTTILAAKSMLINQENTKATKGVAKTMAAEAYSSVEKTKRLESKLAALKGSTISALTSLQLETACQKIMDLKTRLDAIQVKYEIAKNEIGCYIPQIQDLKRVVSELHFVAYANDEELMQRMKS
ncbi:hypothetical protein ACFX2J_046776 [Malus domestica]